MRTTVTLETDVAIRLDRLRRERRLGFKQALNQALREGLARLETPSSPAPFQTRAVNVGRLLVDVDNVAEALEIAEGPGYKIAG